MTTITKAMKFNAVADFLANSSTEFQIADTTVSASDMADFLRHESEMASKRNSPKKPTKTQIENNGFKAEIVAYLTNVDAPKTIKELQAGIPSISGLTNQRITHMLTDLVKAGTLTKEYVKKTPYYSVA